MHEPRPSLLEILARAGYGARGLTYCLVGGLALLAAFGEGGRTGGSRSALMVLIDRPFGRLLLGAVAVGLAGFALWRWVEAATDADRCGRSAKGLAVRAGHVVSGILYASLALSVLRTALGQGGGSEDEAARDWTAWLLREPFGAAVVGAAGLAVIGTGCAFLLKGWRGDVTRHLALPVDARSWATVAGRLGYAARGIVFWLIGGVLVAAAIESRSGAVTGLGGALSVLRDQPYRGVLLGLTAAGLAAFGAFGLVQARFRRIDPPDIDDLAPGRRGRRP
ncbi:DUF1206 domain-containing protein [Methylobacterium nodulans]|uniref:DUF1206 domain-containing protein n=1 Tax=Methylobacterium nodulans (strain LMG 21967 / CNCM I-2342 / ORS 2060) TaxID=460265 RepID=B8IQ11_METNO|nr:DUF1206 domain-containing protein [Methylobacterium nodulans]ACL56661.1 protein of unknown function DUF1206 [Methylobacterium nodulans ORS 2060]